MNGHSSTIINTVSASIIVVFLAWTSVELNSIGKSMARVQTTLAHIKELPNSVVNLREKLSIIDERLRQLEDTNFRRREYDP